jgi:ketosteroid isomerase-like protein
MIDRQGLAARYFQAMRDKDLPTLRTLFAADAVLSVPDGRSFQGIEAICGWFEQLFASVAPSPTCVAELATPRAIAAEIETALPNGTVRRTANFFDIDERGLVKGLRTYARS